MSRNGSGTYSLPAGNPVVTGTVISSTWANNTLSDIATALTQSIAVDGQSPVTADIPLNGHKLTGVAAGSNANDAIVYGQSNASLAGLALTDALNTAQGADIASAGTINLDTATGNLVDVTGTTSITAVTLSQGRFRLVRFTGILTLTNGASLILPGGTNITTAAGDYALFEGYASSVVRVAFYQKASGLPVVETSQTVYRNYISGCILSTAGSSSTMSIAAGQAVDSTNVYVMTLAAISKTTSAWAVGSGNGGLDTGAIANSTWYHFYVIKRLDTGVTDVVFSTSASSPTLPANYTIYRRIGSGKTNGSAQWIGFTQDGDNFVWTDTVRDINATNPGTSGVTATLASVPTGVNVWAQFRALAFTTSAVSIRALYSDLATTDAAPTNSGAPLSNTESVSAASIAGYYAGQIRTNTSAQIRYRLSGSDANTTVQIVTTGWIDPRGKQ